MEPNQNDIEKNKHINVQNVENNSKQHIQNDIQQNDQGTFQEVDQQQLSQIEFKELPNKQQKLLSETKAILVNNMNKTINLTFEIEKKKLMENYDPLQRPFSLKDSLLHKKANKIYKPINQQQINQLHLQKQNICYCCGKLEDGEQFDITVNTIQLSQMGPIIPLYFQFLRYGAGFMLLIFLISGIITIVETVEGNKCLYQESNSDLSTHCSSLFTSLSSYNVNYVDPDNPISTYNFILMFVLMAYTLIYKRQMAKLKYDIDKKVCSPSDYTVIIKNVPRGKNVQFNKKEFEDQIKQIAEKANQLNKQQKVQEVRIESISYAYNLDVIQQAEKLYNQIKQALLINDKKTLESFRLMDNQQAENKLKDLKQEINQYKKDCIENDSLEKCAGSAFVTFSTELEQINFLNYFKKHQKRTCKNYCMMKTDVFLEQHKELFQINCLPAHEPNDIIWKNLHVEYNVKQKQRNITYGKTGILLLFITAIIFALEYIQHAEALKSNNYSIELALSIIIGILIAIANFILSIYLEYLCEQEFWGNYTHFYISLTVKTTMSAFINTTLITFILKLLFKRKDIHVNGGLITTVSTIIITNSIIPPLLEVFDVYSFMSWFWQNRYKKESWSAYINQQDANILYQDRKMDYASKFSRNMNTILLGTFYSYLIPFGPLVCFLNLFITFFADRYSLLRKQSCPLPVGSELMEKMMVIFWDYLIVFQAGGQVLFQQFIYGKVHFISLLQLILAAIFSVLPIQYYMSKWVSRKNLKDNYIEQLSYKEAKDNLNFETDYARENPITKSLEIENYFQFLQNKIQNGDLEQKKCQ